jgi:hypothetical protein
MDLTHRGNQGLAGCVLEQVATGACGKSVEDVRGILIHRQHHKLRVREQRLERTHTLHAVSPREIDINERDMRLEPGELGDGAFAIWKFAHAREAVGVAQPLHEYLPDRYVVFHHDNVDR